MTVYKNIDLEAGLASKLAIDLIKGDTAGADALATGTVTDPTTNQPVKSALRDPGGDLKDNIKEPFDDGFATGVRRLHRAVRQACTQAGIS